MSCLNGGRMDDAERDQLHAIVKAELPNISGIILWMNRPA